MIFSQFLFPLIPLKWSSWLLARLLYLFPSELHPLSISVFLSNDILLFSFLSSPLSYFFDKLIMPCNVQKSKNSYSNITILLSLLSNMPKPDIAFNNTQEISCMHYRYAVNSNTTGNFLTISTTTTCQQAHTHAHTRTQRGDLAQSVISGKLFIG